MGTIDLLLIMSGLDNIMTINISNKGQIFGFMTPIRAAHAMPTFDMTWFYKFIILAICCYEILVDSMNVC